MPSTAGQGDGRERAVGCGATPSRMTFRIPFFFCALLSAWVLPAAEVLPDLSTVPADLVVPKMEDGAPGAGRRVRQTTTGWEKTAVHHALYLPRDWVAGRRYPVIVEYAGNGRYRNAFGDVSNGTVEGSSLGFGLTAGEGAIWICMPFVERSEGEMRNAVTWWGEVAETLRYCRATLREVGGKFGGDETRVVLAGFSRGAIACNFIGLHDDSVAPLWRAFFCHSHYDGVTERWPYAGADRASALVRLARLKGRPQWISHEGSVGGVEAYLRGEGIEGDFTLRAIPFRNHSDQWVLRDVPARREAREWLRRVLATEAEWKP